MTQNEIPKTVDGFAPPPLLQQKERIALLILRRHRTDTSRFLEFRWIRAAVFAGATARILRRWPVISDHLHATLAKSGPHSVLTQI